MRHYGLDWYDVKYCNSLYFRCKNIFVDRKRTKIFYGPSEKWTTSIQQTAHLPPIDFTIKLIHYEPPRSGHLSTPNNGH